MTDRSRIDRRSLLVAALVAGVPLGLAPLRPWRTLVETLPGKPLTATLVDLLESRESAQVVGREYLRATPGETTRRQLVDAIAAGVPGGRRALHTASSADLRKLIAARVWEDFDEAEVVILDGWVVSRTEGRLCALTHV